MSKLTQRLLDRANRVAKEAATVQSELTEAFNARYGVTYSDVDCDWLIDAFDYGGSADRITVAECDKYMAECGAPKLPAGRSALTKETADDR